MAGSIALVGFGVDSFIEVTSGAALLWRMALDADEHNRERIETVSLWIVGACFIVLAAYVAYEALSDLVSQKAPAHSIPRDHPGVRFLSCYASAFSRQTKGRCGAPKRGHER